MLGGRSRSVDSSFVPCLSGFASTRADGYARGKKHVGPLEPVSKQSFAIDLQEQIRQRKEREAMQFTTDYEETPMIERMDQFAARPADGPPTAHLGGPVAPNSKIIYAMELRDQILERERFAAARHGLEQEEAYARQDTEAMQQQSTEKIVKRQLRAAQAAPSKESYAAALQDQISERNARQIVEPTVIQDRGPLSSSPKESDLFKGGRRHFDGSAPIAKSTYASDLKEQMSENEMRRAVERAGSREPLGSDGCTQVVDKSRGRRHLQQMPLPSKGLLTSTLREQIEEHDQHRSLNAFHRQARASSVGPARPPSPLQEGCRRRGAPASMESREAHAQVLQEQVAEKKARLEAERLDRLGKPTKPYFGGAGTSDKDTFLLGRGRRHEAHMMPVSKHSLGSALRDQMSEHERARHTSEPPPLTNACVNAAGGPLPWAGAPAPEKGRRHISAPEPTSKQAYARFLDEQIAEQGLPPDALTDARPRPAASSQAQRPPLPPASQQSSQLLSRSGAAVIGSRRVPEERTQRHVRISEGPSDTLEVYASDHDAERTQLLPI